MTNSPDRCSADSARQCFIPATCPCCKYDRQFPGFKAGGWMQQDNNGPIVPCPLCNNDGSKVLRP